MPQADCKDREEGAGIGMPVSYFDVSPANITEIRSGWAPLPASRSRNSLGTPGAQVCG